MIQSERAIVDALDAGRARGEVAGIGDFLGNQWCARSPDTPTATYAEIGISSQRVSEWRRLRALLASSPRPLRRNVPGDRRRL
jgi:hypothetical protein